MKKNRIWITAALCASLLLWTGCKDADSAGTSQTASEAEGTDALPDGATVKESGTVDKTAGEDGKAQEPARIKEEPTARTRPTEQAKTESTEQEKPAESQKNTAAEALPREDQGPGTENNGHMVAIDAGHQARGSSEKEPVGPGAAQMKARVTGGTRGTTTGLYEYELNLMVAQKLRDRLEERGYTVYMVRETDDVDISNAERAQMAYDSGAEIFVRIHANGSESSAANGAMTICPTADNPYIPYLYEESRKLSDAVLDGLVNSAGCRKERVWETDTMSGINWSSLPVTIVEMGYMTSPEEDAKMATDEYQQKLAEGIADGIEAYFSDARP